ncbi:MAG: hypothetical protein ABFD98_05050 [Syntrophobacteraceae bacterium]
MLGLKQLKNTITNENYRYHKEFGIFMLDWNWEVRADLSLPNGTQSEKAHKWFREWMREIIKQLRINACAIAIYRNKNDIPHFHIHMLGTDRKTGKNLNALPQEMFDEMERIWKRTVKCWIYKSKIGPIQSAQRSSSYITGPKNVSKNNPDGWDIFWYNNKFLEKYRKMNPQVENFPLSLLHKLPQS